MTGYWHGLVQEIIDNLLPRYINTQKTLGQYIPLIIQLTAFRRVQISRDICTPEDRLEIRPHGHNNLAVYYH